MIFFESLSEAFRSIKANLVRSLLTMLGIIIGIASVSTLVGIGEGFKQEFTGQVNSLGANIIFVAPGDAKNVTGGGGGFSQLSQTVSSTLSETDVDNIRSLAHVNGATGVSLVGGVTRHQDMVSQTTLTAGFNADVFSIFDDEIASGRLFTAKDNADEAKVAVLSAKAAKNLFGDDNPVGKKLTIFDNEFEVVGVLKAKDVQSSSTFTTGFDDVVFVPIRTASKVTDSKNIIRIILQVDSAEEVTPTKQAIEAKLMERHEIKDFSVLTQEDIVGVFDDVFGVLSNAILGITAISLLVGGIGIMNIMLVSVTERTREIGLRKAVGASRFAILSQFLIEAIVMSILGGVIGYIIALVGGNVASHFLGFDIPVTAKSIILAFSVSIGVGVIFGTAPAIRASQKHPIDALRYE